jgi:ubiquitin thioesterase OTU1
MEETVPIRRYVDADNSCLFSSIAYLIDRKNFNETSPILYRNMIVEYLIHNDFDESLLDIQKVDYIEEIMKPNKWGGGIEIKIFTEIFKIEIAVIDILTNRVDLFGEDKNYENRIFIIYTGIHYDPLVMNFDETGDSETDITIFKTSDDNTLLKFKELGKKYTEKGDYVDFSKLMSLECMDCNQKFLNDESATNHAKNKEHWNFKQI